MTDDIDRNGASSQHESVDTPHARRIDPNAPETIHDAEDHEEAMIDEGVEETFPASDPTPAKHIT